MAKITFNTKLDKLFALSFELKKIMSDIEKRAALLEKKQRLIQTMQNTLTPMVLKLLVK